jgi:hypothetical protein
MVETDLISGNHNHQCHLRSIKISGMCFYNYPVLKNYFKFAIQFSIIYAAS